MRALKTLVVIMGVLIVLVSGFLVYGLMQRSSDPNFSFFGKAQPKAAATSGPAVPLATDSAAGLAPFGDVTVRLPAGCTVEDMKPDGGRLFVRVGPASGACSQIVVVDLASGKVLGNVKFWNAP
jgi:hypothetical protein